MKNKWLLWFVLILISIGVYNHFQYRINPEKVIVGSWEIIAFLDEDYNWQEVSNTNVRQIIEFLPDKTCYTYLKGVEDDKTYLGTMKRREKTTLFFERSKDNFVFEVELLNNKRAKIFSDEGCFLISKK